MPTKLDWCKHLSKTRRPLLDRVSDIDFVFILGSITAHSRYGAKWPIHYPRTRLNRICRRRQIILPQFNDQSRPDAEERCPCFEARNYKWYVVVRSGLLVDRKSERIPLNDTLPEGEVFLISILGHLKHTVGWSTVQRHSIRAMRMK